MFCYGASSLCLSSVLGRSLPAIFYFFHYSFFVSVFSSDENSATYFLRVCECVCQHKIDLGYWFIFIADENSIRYPRGSICYFLKNFWMFRGDKTFSSNIFRFAFLGRYFLRVGVVVVTKTSAALTVAIILAFYRIASLMFYSFLAFFDSERCSERL